MLKLPSRLSVITLGARDLPRLRRFYRGLGWKELPPCADGRSGLLLGEVLLALRPMAAPACGVPRAPGWSGITLTCVVDSSQQVDAAFAAAVAEDATAVAAPADRPSGSRSACIADPEGNRWEIAWAPVAGRRTGTDEELSAVRPPIDPPEVHRATAELLHHRGAPDEAVAAHLVAAGGTGPDWAAETLLSTARTARREGRTIRAVDLLRRALAEPLPPGRRGGALTELGCLEVTLGPAERNAGVRHLAEAVRLEQQSDLAVFKAANALGAALAARGQTSTALEVMEELAERFADHPELSRATQGASALIASHDAHSWLETVDGLRRPPTRTPRHSTPTAHTPAHPTPATRTPPEPAPAAHTPPRPTPALHTPPCPTPAARTSPRPAPAARTSPRPAPAIRATPRPAPAARALLAEFDSTSGQLSAVEAAAVAREVTAGPLGPFSRTYVLASAATLAQWADELALADRLVKDGMARHRGPSVDPGYQSLLSVHAESLVMRGRYHELLEACRSWGILGVPSAHPAPCGPDNVHLVAQAVIALTETGRTAEARRLAGSVTADASQGSWEWNEFLYARGLLALADGDPADALDDLLECGHRQSERQVISPIVTPWRSAAADCHLLLGRAGAAVALAAEELETARRWGTFRCIGRAMRALGTATGGRAGLATVEQAVDLLRTSDTTPELLSALVAQGRMLTEAGCRTAARQALREAARHAERIGAGRSSTVIADLLAAAGARRATAPQTGAHALTATERRICGLAAQGLSNPEIAALLHVALRTVETHLTNSFRKLGVRRRTALAGRLTTEPPAPVR